MAKISCKTCRLGCTVRIRRRKLARTSCRSRSFFRPKLTISN